MLSSKNRLLREYSKILKTGLRIRSKYFQLFYLKNNMDFSRYGIIVSKKHGKAVLRNYIKRLFRYYIREFIKDTKAKNHYDIIIIPYYIDSNWSDKKDIKREILNTLSKII